VIVHPLNILFHKALQASTNILTNKYTKQKLLDERDNFCGQVKI